MDVFEEDKMHLFAALKQGQYEKLEEKKVTFSFQLKGGQSGIDDQTVDIAVDNKTSTCQIKFPLVKDDEDNYPVAYKVEANKKKSTGKETYTVWPRDFQLKTTHKVDGKEELCEGFTFQIKSGEKVEDKDKELKTDDKGIHDYVCSKKALNEIMAVSPWVIKSWKKKKGRKREALVERKPYTAEIVWGGKTDKKVKQYVNLPHRADSNDGHKIKVKIMAKGDRQRPNEERLGLENDEIFVEVVFGSENSKRNLPKPELKGQAAEADKRTFKKTVKLGPNGDGAELEIELGAASGDVCEIKAGVTDKCSDDSVEITTWKKVKMEIVQPDPGVLSSYTVFDSGNKLGLGKPYLADFKKALDPIFIEFTVGAPVKYAAADIDAAAAGSSAWRIYDAKHFKKKAGDKIVCFTRLTATSIRTAKFPAQANNAFVTCWMDFLLDAGRVQPAYSVSMVMDKDNKTHKVPNSEMLFPYDPAQDTKVNGVFVMVWKVVQYKDGTWKNVTAAGHPGGDKMASQVVTIDWSGELAEYLEIKDYKTIKVKLPARAAHPEDAGHFLKVKKDLGGGEKEYQTKIQVDIWFNSARAGALASGWHGYINMSTMGGKFKSGGIVSTLLHELGHNMAQAYASKAVDATYGGHANHEIPGIAFPAGVPGGFVYGDHDHTGTHCAFGLTASQRGDASFQGKAYADNAKCVMFGSGDMNRAKLFKFCEKCEPFVKGVDASDITTHWERP